MINPYNTIAESGCIEKADAYFPSIREQIALEQSNWKRLILAAKAAYDKGYKEDGLRIYKAALLQADRALSHKREELIEFLQENVWSPRRNSQ